MVRLGKSGAFVGILSFIIAVIIVNRVLFSTRKLGHFYNVLRGANAQDGLYVNSLESKSFPRLKTLSNRYHKIFNRNNFNLSHLSSYIHEMSIPIALSFNGASGTGETNFTDINDISISLESGDDISVQLTDVDISPAIEVSNERDSNKNDVISTAAVAGSSWSFTSLVDSQLLHDTTKIEANLNNLRKTQFKWAPSKGLPLTNTGTSNSNANTKSNINNARGSNSESISNIVDNRDFGRSSSTVSGLSLPPVVSLSKGAEVGSDNPFIEEVYKIFNDVARFNDIVGFNGHQIKALFSPDSIDKGVELSARSNYSHVGVKGIHRWGHVQQLLKEAHSRGNLGEKNISAVRLFNEHKIGDFYELITNEYRHQNPALMKQRSGILNKDEILSIFEHQDHQTKFVWLNSGDENWGFLSTPINTRTTKWINMTNHLRIHNANHDTIKTLIDSPLVALIVCNSHVDPLIGAHEKIITLPLGVNGNHKKDIINMVIKFVKDSKVKKDKLLYINNSGWGDRTLINALFFEKFKNSKWHPLTNSYSTGKSFGVLAREIASSKFVLCPSGLGFDTYRLWETLLLGAIPVVESNPGFDRAYSMLPVLVVRNYTDVTPAMLEQIYPCFYRNAHRFNYQHLTRTHWFQLIDNATIVGSAVPSLLHHPFKNPICSVL